MPIASTSSPTVHLCIYSSHEILYPERDFHCRGNNNVLSWRSSACYGAVRKGDSAIRFSTAKHAAKRSLPITRCATIEEIGAEKSLVENEARERMEKVIKTIRAKFNTIRIGRANPTMLDHIEIECHGNPVHLPSIAQISTPDQNSLLVHPYEKSCLKSIEKAIVTSGLGLTTKNDGESVRLSIPQLTSERKKVLSKIIAKQAEGGKTAIRNIRREAVKTYGRMEKVKKLTKDNVMDLMNDLQKLTDTYIRNIDAILRLQD